MTDAPIIVGQVKCFVHHQDGTVAEDSLLITATEHGIALALGPFAVGVCTEDAAQLADDVAEAGAHARNMARDAQIAREREMAARADELIAETLGAQYRLRSS